MTAMTITEVRRRALQAVIDQRFGGVQSRFGIAVGRQSDYISRLLAGKKQLGERLARDIERALGLELGYLDREPVQIKPDLLTDFVLRRRGVPILSWGSLAEKIAQQEKIIDMASTAATDAAQFAPRPAGIGDTVFALPVQGSAMEPEFREKWLVYVDPAVTPKHGDYVVVLLEGQATPVLRQLQVEGDLNFLRITNSAFPDPMVALGRGQIIGRVVFQARTY